MWLLYELGILFSMLIKKRKLAEQPPEDQPEA